MLLELLEASLLLNIGNSPLLEVFDPSGGAVLFELGRLGSAGLASCGHAGLLGGVDYIVGIETGEVSIAGGPADLALVAGWDGVAGADGVSTGLGGEWPQAHDVMLCDVGRVGDGKLNGPKEYVGLVGVSWLECDGYNELIN